MHWRLATLRPPPRHFRTALYAHSIRWQEADFGTEFYRGNGFRERLLPIQGADSVGYSAEKLAADKPVWQRAGLTKPVFSLADLAAMKRRYAQDPRMSWLALATETKLTTHKSGGYHLIVHAFTVPLFSLDGNYALLWELVYQGGRFLSAQLAIYKRVSGTTWQRVPARLPGQTA